MMWNAVLSEPMSERGRRASGAGAGAPFYAPPRRKTSAEIISEARAAVYGGRGSAEDMSGSSAGSGAGGAVRALRTRRPFTPREPQRTLFTERARRRDARPPSAFDLKYLSLADGREDPGAGGRIATLDEEVLHEVMGDAHTVRRKPVLRSTKSVQDRAGDGWGGFPKLPHLSGRSKPLHRRDNTGGTIDKAELELAQAISVTRPLVSLGEDKHVISNVVKSQNPDATAKKKQQQYAASKAYSCEASTGFSDIGVRHLAVQLPNTINDNYGNMSLLELSEALSQRGCDDDKALQLLEAMILLLQGGGPAGSLREMVLRALYAHVDSEDERVLVAIARGMLTMRVTGNHLSAACKLVFKIARNDKNDHFFRNTNLLELVVEGCGRADPVTEGECCVYGGGALRFLALEPRLRARATAAGALHLAALHLKILNNAKAENPRSVSEQSTHALYQLTGALRNLAGGAAGGEAGDARAFVTSGALSELVTALQHHTDRDVLTNVARCLSVLSAEESCCAWLCARVRCARALLRALAACAARAALAVRLAYTLGNMAAADDTARVNIYSEEGSVDVLLTILESYTKRGSHDAKDADEDPDLHLIGSDLGGSDGSNEDVLIKTVRVVANLCLAERAGRGLAGAHAGRAVAALLACLAVAGREVDETAYPTPEAVEICRARRAELAAAALATLNNVTFYREPPEPPDPLADTLDTLCQVCCRWAVPAAGAAGCEAVRALGNLSRAPQAAQRIALHGALDALAPFLAHEDSSVRCAGAGVLVNVCGAGAARGAAAALAARALRAAAETGDQAAAALLARALWNAHAHSPLTAAEAQQAATALHMFIDDESVFAACEEAEPAGARGERRASHPDVSHHVKFDLDNNNFTEGTDAARFQKPIIKAYSIDQNLHLDEYPSDHGTATGDSDSDRAGEDLGFEEGSGSAECGCPPCRRLAAWEELVGVAIPLLEKLRPHRSDASVGTD